MLLGLLVYTASLLCIPQTANVLMMFIPERCHSNDSSETNFHHCCSNLLPFATLLKCELLKFQIQMKHILRRFARLLAAGRPFEKRAPLFMFYQYSIL